MLNRGGVDEGDQEARGRRQPETRNQKPEAANTKIETRNPKPEDENPKL